MAADKGGVLSKKTKTKAGGAADGEKKKKKRRGRVMKPSQRKSKVHVQRVVSHLDPQPGHGMCLTALPLLPQKRPRKKSQKYF